MELIFDLEDIGEAATAILKHTAGKTVYALKGEIGSGKTTLINALCKALGVRDNVSSPTFSIINQYTNQEGQPVFHMDMYRLKDEQEAIHAGVEDSLYSGHTCFVEWPEMISALLPPGSLFLSLSVITTNVRKLQINM